MTQPYREPARELTPQEKEEKKAMDENEKQVRIGWQVVICGLGIILGLSGAVLYGTIDGNRANDQIEHERTAARREETAKAVADANKAMFEHMQCWEKK